MRCNWVRKWTPKHNRYWRSYNNSLYAEYYKIKVARPAVLPWLSNYLNDLVHEAKTIKFSRQAYLYISLEMTMTADIEGYVQWYSRKFRHKANYRTLKAQTKSQQDWRRRYSAPVLLKRSSVNDLDLWPLDLIGRRWSKFHGPNSSWATRYRTHWTEVKILRKFKSREHAMGFR